MAEKQKDEVVEPSLDKAKEVLQSLLSRYNQYKEDKSFMGNEKQACTSLIIPLIHKFLHWDTESPSEFKTEESQGGKRIDYVVYNQGISQFIIEAKAPSKDIFDNSIYYKQALEYGYGKEHDFAILTNFRQIVILGCQVKFRVVPETEIARIDLINASDDDLRLLLSFEKDYWVNSGKDNPLFTKLSKHTKTVSVDEQLLEDMKHWREKLLRNIKANSRFNKFDFEDEDEFMQIEEEVQKIIDRFIFICYSEDKELHEPQLKRYMYDKEERFGLKPGYLLSKIQELFAEYRRVYDSDLFDKSDCDDFRIDDAVFLEIIRDLREPKERVPYDFKSIEADILGKTYENFIGHIQTGKKRFTEKEDMGKRKKEGIYYTPKYVVDYIVNNTVREYVKGKSFAEINKVKVLDPACGSGSFLLRAFDVLVEESEKSLKRSLSYDEKKNLMLNCVFGVDLDRRAVDIAKLNLSLKLAWKEKLPMLRENIRQGNSLIDDKEYVKYEFDAFKWEDEFPEIFANGGFDVVVGNPPYFNLQTVRDEKQSLFFGKNYFSYRGKADILYLFIEKANQVLKKGGCLGLIVANYFLRSYYADKLREFISKNYTIIKIADFGSIKVFPEANVDTSIIIFKKYKTENNKLTYGLLRNDGEVISFLNEVNKSKVIDNNNYKIILDVQSNKDHLPWKFGEDILSDTTLLSQICNIGKGAATGNDEIFVINKDFIKSLNLEKELLDAVVDDSSIEKYHFKVSNNVLIRTKRGTELSKYPNIKSYLESKKSVLKSRYAVQKEGLNWFEIVRYNDDLFGPEIKEQIYAYYRSTHNKFAYSDRKFVTLTTTFVITRKKDSKINLKYLLGILNSKVIESYSKKNAKKMGNCFEYSSNFISSIPIKIISEPQQQPLIKLVDRMLSLHQQLNEEKSLEIKQKLQKEIEKTNREIDELVYQLYGITEEEKKIIEESLK